MRFLGGPTESVTSASGVSDALLSGCYSDLAGTSSAFSTPTPSARRTRYSRRRRWRRRRLSLSPHRVTAACGGGCFCGSIVHEDGCVSFCYPIGDRVYALLKSGDFLEEPLPPSPNAARDCALSLAGAPLSDVRPESRPEGAPFGHVRRALVQGFLGTIPNVAVVRTHWSSSRFRTLSATFRSCLMSSAR